MEKPKIRASLKKPMVNVSSRVSKEIVNEARKLGINISETIREALTFIVNEEKKFRNKGGA